MWILEMSEILPIKTIKDFILQFCFTLMDQSVSL